VRDWKTGNEVAADTFAFNNATNARRSMSQTLAMSMNCRANSKDPPNETASDSSGRHRRIHGVRYTRA
jgi:hypothetical protein